MKTIRQIDDVELIELYEDSKSFGWQIWIFEFLQVAFFVMLWHISKIVFGIYLGLVLVVHIFNFTSYNTRIYLQELKRRGLI